MARPAIVVAPRRRSAGAVAASCARPASMRSPSPPRRARGPAHRSPRRRGRDPRRRDRPRHLARVLRPAPRGAGATSRRSWSCRRERLDRLSAGPSPRRRRVLQPALHRPTRSAGGSRRCASGRDRRRRLRARSSRAARWRWATGRAGRRSSRSSTRRAASARRRSPRTSRPRSSSTRPEGPADRRRHRDRPRHDVARHSSTSGPSPTAGSDQAEGGPSRRSPRSPRRIPSGPDGRRADLVADRTPRSSSRPASPTRSPRPAAAYDFIVVDLHPSYSSREPGGLREGRPDPRPGHAGRARRCAPPSSSATSPVEMGAARTGSRSSSTARTAASRSRTWSATVGMAALALIRSGGLLFVRAANEGRTVIDMYPSGEDHRGLRRPRRPARRDDDRRGRRRLAREGRVPDLRPRSSRSRAPQPQRRSPARA